MCSPALIPVAIGAGTGLMQGLGKKAEANPWGGVTLEWTIPSPPPLENFEEIPTVTTGPYHFPQEEKG